MNKVYRKELFKHEGFTLIELMIAVSILSLLLFTGSYSYSLMSERWDKELGRFSDSAQTAKHLELTQLLLEGIQSYIVVDPAKKPFFFFIGHQDSLLAVSQRGLFNDEYPEVFRLTVSEKENGLVDLVYQSTSTKDVKLLSTVQSIKFLKSITLFSNVDAISFEYFGWNSYDEKTDNANSRFKEGWFNNYSGIDKRYMPSKLRLIIDKEGQGLVIPIELQTDVEKWLSPYFNNDA